uniref:Uncharacterized protein n=1 Tax=Timema shepardi TaxID=629360 RepID=A0A7R9B0I5_TIMSH|nr:unnamed protein product [Timema shepardi]
MPLAPLGLRRGDQCQSDYSRPPSYRSRTSSTRPTLDPSGHPASEHSRDPSLSLSESGGGSAVVNVISVMGDPRTDRLDNIKLAPPGPDDVSLRMPLNKSGGMKDPGNLVTIVQTSSEPSPVIVTVSGSTTTIGGSTSNQHGNDTEMEILAHL